MRSAFTEDKLTKFIKDLLEGKENLLRFKSDLP